MNAEEIYNILKEKFGEKIVTELDAEKPVDPIISVDPLKINDVCEYLRDDEQLQFDSLMNLSGVDDNNAEKVKNEDGTIITQGGTLSVFYHLDSTILKHKITLKVTVDKDTPEVESVAKIWFASNWHEREAFDMYGIIFLNHPDLRRILMPDDWDGYPLRKDYENPEYYDGMKIPY